jgi:predicted NBD/HSP70 family sugar kinase
LTASEELAPHTIIAAAQAGDELALAALSEVGRHLGMVMAACVAVLNPAMIVIGGGTGLAAFDWLAPAARRELALRTLPASHQNLQIVPSRLPSSAVGAACLVWYYQKTDSPTRKERR